MIVALDHHIGASYPETNQGVVEFFAACRLITVGLEDETFVQRWVQVLHLKITTVSAIPAALQLAMEWTATATKNGF